MAAFLIHLEIYLILINSLPIPSLDSYGVIQLWLANEIQTRLRKFSKYEILFLFMVLWFVAPVGKFFGSLSNSIAQLISVPLETTSVGFALFNRHLGFYVSNYCYYFFHTSSNAKSSRSLV